MMGRRLTSFLRFALFFIAVTVGIGTFASDAALAQDADVDWEDAGIGSQEPIPDGTTLTASDGTSATVNVSVATQGGGAFDPAFSTGFLSYFAGTIGNGQTALFTSFDNSAFDPNDRVTVTITLSRAVTDFRFSLDDIDMGSGTANFTDAVEVGFDNNLAGGFSNAATNTAFWTAGPSVTRTNNAVVNGWLGTAPSPQESTDGSLEFDFGDTAVRRIQIVFFSNTGTGDPIGQFVGISDLTFAGEGGADLSLTKTLVGSPPAEGFDASWLLTVTNNTNSALSANGIVVQDTFPPNFVFNRATGTGTFTLAGGIGTWTLGTTLTPGQSASITISGTISSELGTTVTNVAQIMASNQFDPDSTPNNGVTTEDDYASVSFTVAQGRAPGVPPVLRCPAGSSIFDWADATSWVPGSIDNTFAFASFGDVRFLLENDGAYVSNAAFGGATPNVTATFGGGLNPAEESLTIVSDQANLAGEVTIGITLPRSFTGLQFSVFDVDFRDTQFADRIEIVGSNGNGDVLPTITRGAVNTVTNNSAFGDGASATADDLGNITVTFTEAVSSVTIRYGNGPTAPANPGQQGIGLHDITFCNPFTTLGVTKVSSVVSDPVNGTTNPKAIPGALIEYLITVTNEGSEPADQDSVIILDDGPADAKLCRIARGAGPVVVNDPGGDSGLSFTFTSLASDTDSIDFSNDDGSNFNYEPSADADGCDALVTDFRISPIGTFAAGAALTLRVQYIVN